MYLKKQVIGQTELAAREKGAHFEFQIIFWIVMLSSFIYSYYVIWGKKHDSPIFKSRIRLKQR